MIARSEAHDSGLCAADLATRRGFATDLLNLTLAGPRVNRYEKVDRDAVEWLPAQNRCWFAARVIAVRQRYGLTVDRREVDALDQVLAGCASTELITFARGEVPATATPADRVPEAIAAWDDNRNGRLRLRRRRGGFVGHRCGSGDDSQGTPGDFPRRGADGPHPTPWRRTASHPAGSTPASRPRSKPWWIR